MKIVDGRTTNDLDSLGGDGCGCEVMSDGFWFGFERIVFFGEESAGLGEEKGMEGRERSQRERSRATRSARKDAKTHRVEEPQNLVKPGSESFSHSLV